MKKTKVSLQFTSELLIVCIISLMIGATIGSFLSVPVSNKLLANEIENSQNKYEDISRNFGRGNNANTEKIKEEKNESKEDVSDNEDIGEKEQKKEDKYNFGLAQIGEVNSINAVVDYKILLKLLGIGVSLTLLSSLATMIAISRFSPLTILKERS